MKEIWKDVKDYVGYYQVSNLGRIKSLPRNGTINTEKILKPNIIKNGYCQVCLQKDGKRKYEKVHRLVAETFIPNTNNLPQVNHKDGNKQNNNANNLEWCSVSYNQLHNCYVLKHNIKQVKQYSLDNVLLKIWDSVRLASRKTNIKCSNIVACIQGKQKTCGGYIWKY